MITADALHTQRDHLDHLHARGAHWVLTVKGNQPILHAQLAGLPWRQIEVCHRATGNAHGRREIRTLKVVTIAAGIAFPHAAQAIQLTRKTQPLRESYIRRALGLLPGTFVRREMTESGPSAQLDSSRTTSRTRLPGMSTLLPVTRSA